MHRLIDLISGRVVIKLLLVSLSIFGVALALLFTIVEVRNAQIARRALIDDLQALTETSLPPLAAALWEYDIDRVNAFLPDLEILRFVQGVWVEDLSGNIIAKRGNIDDVPSNPEFIAKEELVFEFGGNVRELGSVTIFATDREITDRLYSDIRNDVFVFAALAIVVSCLVFFTTNHFFGTPLRRLDASIGRFRRDGVREQVEWNSHDEIGHIVRAFNAMQFRQEETETQLKNALSDLTAARERERARQSEYSRVARSTTASAMAASIAHEVSQPLAAIAANSSAALRWLSRAEPDIEEAKSSLRNIARDGQRAGDVIAGIRSLFTQDSSGDRADQKINEIIRESLEFLQPEMDKLDISVELDLADDLPSLVVHRVQIQQVILNLLNNAIEAMRTVSDRDRCLCVRASLIAGDKVAIKIEDTGTGIDPENLDRIFDPFFTSKADGMGMGLSICRSIVESHGGRLSAAPGANCGSVFEMSLPVDNQASAA